MKTKRDAAYSFTHTKKRAKERYNIDLNPILYEIWASKCREQVLKGQYIKQEQELSEMQTIHSIEWNGRLILCVFGHGRSCITTVLPLENRKEVVSTLHEQQKTPETKIMRGESSLSDISTSASSSQDPKSM